MKRDLHRLSDDRFDLIVVGGGIHGAFIAWDASLRGLSVALVEKDDFASGASSHSLKTIHGGLRYLQHFDFSRMRSSVRERSTLMRIAPHLVAPLPCLMPTAPGLSTKNRFVMRAAMMVSDMVAHDRNRELPAEKQIPACRILTKKECERVIPGFSTLRATGAALWTDAQVRNSERLIIDTIRAAAGAGAAVANHLAMDRPIVDGARVRGIAARDMRTGDPLEIRGSLVINAAGSWMPSMLGGGSAPVPYKHRALVGGFNLVLKRRLIDRYGLGVSTRHDGNARLYFLVPWRGITIAGTEYKNLAGRVEDFRVTEADVETLVANINRAWPAAELELSDISYIHRGVLPARSPDIADAGRNLLGRYCITDHASDGADGLVTVLGVKYTTARDVAEKAVDLAVRKLGRGEAVSKTAVTALPAAVAAGEDAGEERILHAVRQEMALTLEDLVLRRLEVGELACPDRKTLASCAAVMGKELSWDERRTEEETRRVEQFYYRHRGPDEAERGNHESG